MEEDRIWKDIVQEDIIEKDKNTDRKDRIRKVICCLLGICIGAFLTGVYVSQRAMEVDARISKIQGNLSKEVFRFHVLADSDSDEAQRVKLKVRDEVLEYMKQTMPGNEDMVSASQTKKWAKEHLREIEDVAERVIREEGYSYRAKAEVSVCYFPDKRYGDITFPQGYYEALRIKLGKAEGQNWWCVLYPNLCFTSSTCAVVDEEGKEELKSVLTDEEYEMITATSDFKIKSFFFGDGTDDESK